MLFSECSCYDNFVLFCVISRLVAEMNELHSRLGIQNHKSNDKNSRSCLEMKFGKNMLVLKCNYV